MLALCLEEQHLPCSQNYLFSFFAKFRKGARASSSQTESHSRSRFAADLTFDICVGKYSGDIQSEDTGSGSTVHRVRVLFSRSWDVQFAVQQSCKAWTPLTMPLILSGAWVTSSLWSSKDQTKPNPRPKISFQNWLIWSSRLLTHTGYVTKPSIYSHSNEAMSNTDSGSMVALSNQTVSHIRLVPQKTLFRVNSQRGVNYFRSVFTFAD